MTKKNPSGPVSGSYRVLRGGSWINGAQLLRPADRTLGGPSIRNSIIGFRLARTSNNPVPPNSFTLEEIKIRLKRFYKKKSYSEYKKAMKEFE